MDNNTPTTVPLVDQRAKEWIKDANIQQQRDQMYAHAGYAEGYNSRNEEVEELVNHIRRMFDTNSWDGENREGVRKATQTILTKYNK